MDKRNFLSVRDLRHRGVQGHQNPFEFMFIKISSRLCLRFIETFTVGIIWMRLGLDFGFSVRGGREVGSSRNVGSQKTIQTLGRE
jgi:hypothetical protein